MHVEDACEDELNRDRKSISDVRIQNQKKLYASSSDSSPFTSGHFWNSDGSDGIASALLGSGTQDPATL